MNSDLRTLRPLVVALATALALVLVGPVGAARADAGSFVQAINAERAAVGLPALVVREDLNAAARAQSQRMADRNELHHNPALGDSVSNWQRLAENVGFGPDVATIHRALMDSAPHRANILDAEFTEVGVGTVWSGDRLWVTQVFRVPAPTAPAPPPPAPEPDPTPTQVAPPPSSNPPPPAESTRTSEPVPPVAEPTPTPELAVTVAMASALVVEAPAPAPTGTTPAAVDGIPSVADQSVRRVALTSLVLLVRTTLLDVVDAFA